MSEKATGNPLEDYKRKVGEISYQKSITNLNAALLKSEDRDWLKDMRERFSRIEQETARICTCLVDVCDCQSPNTNPAGVSEECPIHNLYAQPSATCPIHGEVASEWLEDMNERFNRIEEEFAQKTETH